VALGLGMLALPALSCVGGLMLATLSPPIAYRYTPPPLPRSATAVAAPTPAPSVARDLACALDPARLSRRVGIEPDDWQAELLRSDDRQVLVNCSRQVGKSQTTATLAAHTALYCPGEPVLLLSPTLRQSSQLFQKVKWALKRVGATSADATTDNALSVKLANGSEIHSLPGKGGTIRGFSSVHPARVPGARAADAGRALRPGIWLPVPRHRARGVPPRGRGPRDHRRGAAVVRR
jgi:hypothetical protein